MSKRLNPKRCHSNEIPGVAAMWISSASGAGFSTSSAVTNRTVLEGDAAAGTGVAAAAASDETSGAGDTVGANVGGAAATMRGAVPAAAAGAAAGAATGAAARTAFVVPLLGIGSPAIRTPFGAKASEIESASCEGKS